MADVVLEPPIGGMPPAQAQTLPQPPAPAAPPQPPPAPDLSQPLLDEDEPITSPQGDGDAGGEEEQAAPEGRRTLVGDLMRERERRQLFEQQSNQSQALIRQVMSLPGGMELLQAAATGQPPPRQPGQPSAEDEALAQEASEVARDLGLYNAEGQLDLRTAARIVLRDRKRTQTLVESALRPLQQQTLQLGVEPVIAHVLSVADQFGIDRNLVMQGLRATPPEHVNNPQVQQAVLMMALGTQVMLGSQQGQAPQPGQRRAPAAGPQNGGVQRQAQTFQPPIFTEAPGGRPRAQAPALDPVFRDRLKSTGMKDTDIDGTLSRFVPGAPNRLE